MTMSDRLKLATLIALLNSTVLNAGKRHKVYATGGAVTVQAIVGDDGHPVSDPVPLNANGSKWTSGAFHYLYFDVYEEFNFANLLT